jgi:hypothetical protein
MVQPQSKTPHTSAADTYALTVPSAAVGGGSSYPHAPESLTARFLLSIGGTAMAKTIMVIKGTGKFSQICKVLSLAAQVGGPTLTIGQIAKRGF